MNTVGDWGIFFCQMADIRIASWEKSPLYALFDDVVFSYEVGYVKPQPQIYEIALKRLQNNMD